MNDNAGIGDVPIPALSCLLLNWLSVLRCWLGLHRRRWVSVVMNQLPLTLLKPEDSGGSESQIDGLAVDDLIASHFHARGEAHVRTDRDGQVFADERAAHLHGCFLLELRLNSLPTNNPVRRGSKVTDIRLLRPDIVHHLGIASEHHVDGQIQLAVCCTQGLLGSGLLVSLVTGSGEFVNHASGATGEKRCGND